MCVKHSYEHLQKGRNGAKGFITNFKKSIWAYANRENRKSLGLFFVDISSC